MDHQPFDTQLFADTVYATSVFAFFAITWLIMDHRGAGHTLKRWQRLLTWLKARYEERYVMSFGAVGTDDDDEDAVQNVVKNARSEPRTEPTNAAEPAVQSRTVLRTGSFVLEPEELAGVARMILHKCGAERPTKASIIEAGFACKKGDSAKYKRASLIYDTLFVFPEVPKKYPAITDDQRLLRNMYGLPEKA